MADVEAEKGVESASRMDGERVETEEAGVQGGHEGGSGGAGLSGTRDRKPSFSSMEFGEDVGSSIEIRSGGEELYEIVGVIGQGHHSTVYRAHRIDNGSDVVLKKIRLLEVMDSKLRKDCIREVVHLRSLDHASIIRYLDCYLEDAELVIVLEWASGGDLSHLLRRWKSKGEGLEAKVIWDYFIQVCGAVKHMHERRLMHRDLKPSNIFVASDERTVKVGDLGLSRYFSSKTCQAHSSVGTPYYMSPEIIRGLPYDWSSDVWSLGCLLYELCTLKNPFYQEGLNYYTLGKRICRGEYDGLPLDLPESARSLVESMLQPDPSRRPTVESVFSRALEAVESCANND